MSSLADRSTISLVWQILERKDRWRLSFALVLILVGTVLEMASLSLVIPVVQAVVGGDKRSEYRWLPGQIKELPYGTFVQLLMMSLVMIFMLKNVFLLLSNYYQQRAQFAINNRVVQRLFETYLRQPFEFHLSNSSSILVRNVQEYSSSIVGSGVGPILLILTDTLTGIGLTAVLLFVEPVGTSILGVVFSIVAIALFRFSRNRLTGWGADRVKHRGVMMEALLGGFGGVKEIKLFGRDREVVETHRRSLYQASRSFYLFNVMQNVPRAVFEVVAVGGVALFVVAATLGEGNLQSATLAIALFGVVAFRMLPSVNRIIQSAQQLSFGRTGIVGAVEGLAMSPEETLTLGNRSPTKFESLQISNLKYRYPNTEALAIAIDKLTLRVGESLGIVGASGSGKSTLVDLLIGVLTPTSGHLTVNGHRVDEDPRYWQDRIGYVPQHVYLMDTTVRRNVAFGLPEKVIDANEVERALRLANLWDFVQTLPKGLETVVGERGVRLSGGQRQRLGIARAVYGNPEVIVLDEATSALDEDTEREIVESMREISRDRTMIVVAHRTSTLAHCSRLIRLEAGRIVQDGTFAEVIGSLPNA